MYGGRIESERPGLALDRTGQRAPKPITDVKQSDSRPAEAKLPAPKPFEAFVYPAQQRTANSPRRRLADFVTPKISDPAVLQSAQLVPILERLVGNVLPNLKDSEELRALASTLIADEIARHRDLATRLHNGIAA